MSLSRAEREIQQLIGRRGPRDGNAILWGDIEDVMREIAVRSNTRPLGWQTTFRESIGATAGNVFEDVVNATEQFSINPPSSVDITSSSFDPSGVSTITVDWADVIGATSYQVGVRLDGGGEVYTDSPSSATQFEVTAGSEMQVRVRARNAFGFISEWTPIEFHVAQKDGSVPLTPTGLRADPGFGTVWLEWDANAATDIAVYEIHESTTLDIVTAATPATFQTAGVQFARTGLPEDSVERHYWVRARDKSDNVSPWSAPITVDTLEASVTKATQIADAIIGDAKISSLSAAKLTAGTALASSITVDGTALSTIDNRAADPAAQVNAGTTSIEPGQITIWGATKLSDWRGTSDVTKIRGGEIEANSITTTQLAAGSVQAGNIAAGAITAAKIGANQVTADKINVANLSAISGSLGSIVVGSANIANGSITRAKIGSAAVDSARIQNLSVGTIKIDNNAINDIITYTNDTDRTFWLNSGIVIVFASVSQRADADQGRSFTLSGNGVLLGQAGRSPTSISSDSNSTTGSHAAGAVGHGGGNFRVQISPFRGTVQSCRVTIMVVKR